MGGGRSASPIRQGPFVQQHQLQTPQPGPGRPREARLRRRHSGVAFELRHRPHQRAGLRASTRRRLRRGDCIAKLPKELLSALSALRQPGGVGAMLLGTVTPSGPRTGFLTHRIAVSAQCTSTEHFD